MIPPGHVTSSATSFENHTPQLAQCKSFVFIRVICKIVHCMHKVKNCHTRSTPTSRLQVLKAALLRSAFTISAILGTIFSMHKARVHQETIPQWMYHNMLSINHTLHNYLLTLSSRSSHCSSPASPFSAIAGAVFERVLNDVLPRPPRPPTDSNAV